MTGIAMNKPANRNQSWYSKMKTWLLARFEKPSDIASTLQQFQPAAVELEATPPNSMARSVSKAIVLLFVIAVAWACIGKIDVVAVATGQIIPSERVKDIQPLSLGKVSAIYVQEGQLVQAGDLLLKMDSAIAVADLIEAKEQLFSLSGQLLRAEAMQKYLASESAEESPDLAAILKQHRSELSREFTTRDEQSLNLGVWTLEQEIQTYLSERDSLNQQQQAREAEARMVAANVSGLEQTMPIVQERLAAMEKLVSRNLVSRDQYLGLKQEHIQQQQALVASSENYQQLVNESAEIASRLNSLKSSHLAELATRQEELRRRTSSLKQEIARADVRNNQLELKAPIAGTVQNLSIHTLGGVVQPAEVLMQIVPKDARLEVEAWVENKDIGFVNAGQVAEVKVDSFKFTKYGVIDATLKTLSEDAVNDEQRGPIYRTLVSLEKDWMQVDNKQVRLTPGMSVAVEVKTGKRRLIEYFLSPLLRYSKESVRER